MSCVVSLFFGKRCHPCPPTHAAGIGCGLDTTGVYDPSQVIVNPDRDVERAVVAPSPGAAVGRILAKLKSAGFVPVSHHALQRVAGRGAG
jgi:hypothetical protein